ncbi:MAG TPA: hypothetical protein VLF14_02270 [Candidatus Binatia bacterium]|nr:hypothetical protein [Candidatus Binatia bacterium]
MKRTGLAVCGMIVLGVLLPGCALLIAGAVGGGAAGAAASATQGEEETHSVGAYAGAILGDVLYVPGKVVFAGLGAVTSGLAYLVTLGNAEASASIWNATVEGTYVLTPRHIEGKEPVRFLGP